MSGIIKSFFNFCRGQKIVHYPSHDLEMHFLKNHGARIINGTIPRFRRVSFFLS